jgi:hypothetical protein
MQRASIHKIGLWIVRDAYVIDFAACVAFDKEASAELNRFNIGGVARSQPDSVERKCGRESICHVVGLF